VSRAFVELSDTLVPDFDQAEFLHNLARCCVDLLGVRAAGVMAADRAGVLRVAAASSEPARALQHGELQAAAGPCIDCFTSGEPVTARLDGPDSRWPDLGRQARELGFSAVDAVPMRLRGEAIGVLALFSSDPRTLRPDDVHLGRALASVATIGLLHQQRAVIAQQALAERLQDRLDDRVATEQALGVLAESLDVGRQAALEVLRRHARHTDRSLSEAARDIVHGDHAPAAAGTNAPARRAVLLIRRFDLRSLAALREALHRRAAAQGLADLPLTKFVLAVYEAAVNAVHHGGGHGQLLLWRHADTLWCDITDHGPGIRPARRAPVRPNPDRIQGRGLWLIRQLCTGVDITTDTTGTTVLLRYAVPARSRVPATDPAACRLTPLAAGG
jgi:anti-sigma regulatory factor (Ser/Thr protein kinase)